MASPRVSSARLEALWQSAREPVFWLSADGKFLAVNRAWEELTGYATGDVIGQSSRSSGGDLSGNASGLGGSFTPPPEALDGQPSAAQTLIVHASGERRWRRVLYWPFHDARGALTGFLGLVTPVESPPVVPDSERSRLRTELLRVRDKLFSRHGFDSVIGEGPAHRRLMDQVAAAAGSSIPVLIVGEPGTGRRLVARTIQQRGAHPQAPLVPIDCAALPPDVLERELFGTGESGGSLRLNLPEGATLLVGDVLDLPRDLQGRLAETTDRRVRLIAFTSTEPESALRAERLRPDLYYALTTLVIPLRPLRERLGELPLLAQHLLERVNQRVGRHRSGFSAEALDGLRAYDWPGNVRELDRVIEEAHANAENCEIELGDLPASIRGSLGGAYTPAPVPAAITPLDDLLTQVERRLIETALQRARQNKSRAAELLGISRPRLYRRIRELDIPEEPEPTETSPHPNGSDV